MPAHKPRASPAPATRTSSVGLRRPVASRAPSRWPRTLAVLASFFVLAAIGIRWLESIKAQHYVFDPVKLHALTQSVVAKNHSSTEAIFDEILGALRNDDKIARTLNTRDFRVKEEWMFNNAGGEWA